MISKLLHWLFNNTDWSVFSPLLMILFGCGFIFWFIAYYFIIKDSKKFNYCEMPMLVATGNIAWEFSWTFLFHNEIGHIFTIGAGLWFLRDITINAYAWKFWKADVTNPWIGKTYHWWYIFSLASWFGIVYFMKTCGLDDGLGVVSALVINVVMSSLYIYQLISFPEFRGKGMSYAAAWFKMAGTGVISLASLFVWPENHFLQVLCIVSWILDMVYIVLFKSYKPDAVWLANKKN